jgi:hypothetical protein
LADIRRPMDWKRKTGGGILAFIGFMLSPLSWWNDAFVNIPIAWVFAWLVSLCYKPAFTFSLVLGYWLTNVLGFVLLHKGAQKILSAADKQYARRELIKDLGISLAYTLLIVTLVQYKVIAPFGDYFTK